MRAWPLMLLALAAAHPAAAGQPEPPYYGPMKRWHGIGYKFGYADDVEKDGIWRIEAATRGSEPLDMAMYRAAERARQEGYRYIFFLSGSGYRSPGYSNVTVYARPSHEPTAPVGCRSRACYTADVAAVLRILGGPGGTQPGVAVVDHYDRYGRAVILSGFGTGAVTGSSSVQRVTDGGVEVRSAATPVAAPPPPSARVFATAPSTGPATMLSAPITARQEADARFDRALKAETPVRGRQPGWTIGD